MVKLNFVLIPFFFGERFEQIRSMMTNSELDNWKESPARKPKIRNLTSGM
jgi:hypothetical protein